VGINVTQDAIQVGVGNVGLDLLEEQVRRPDDFDIGQEPELTMQFAARIVEEALATAGLDRSKVVGGAIGVPAPVHSRTGSVGVSSIIPRWHGRNPSEMLASLVDFPVLVENDANLSAFAEAVAGAAEGAAQVLYVEASDRVGSGLIVNGRLYRGATGGAGEITHMVVQPGGALCFCGRRGCLATVVAGRSMVDEVLSGHRRLLARSAFDPDELGSSGLDLDQQMDLITRWARDGDPISSRVLGDAGVRLGLAVANVCNVLNPERVVVGGVLTQAGAIFMDPFVQAVHDHTKVLPGPPVSIVLSRWQERAEVVGAIALGIRGQHEKLAARLWALVEKALREPRGRDSDLSNS
jgi:predicted NBD/HSP70 family sugar kinase